MCFNKIFIICLLGLMVESKLILQGSSGQKEGESCRTRKNTGICRSLDKCPSAIQALQELNQRPAICSFPRGSTVAVVCCVENDITKSKSYQKCVEYSQYHYEWVDSQWEFKKVRVDRCAQPGQPLVVGGAPSLPREFPHMAALGFEDGLTIRWECGGTLISEHFVLTAGHCTSSPDYGEVKRIRVGALNLETDENSKPREYGIAEIIPHPEYKRPSRYNDIALLRTERRVHLNIYTIPACLRWDPAITDTLAIASGWGRTSFGARRSDNLLKVTLELFSQPDCNASYAPLMSNRQLKSGIVPETQLCAGHNTEEKDVCQGDSGGPLQVLQKDGIHCMYSIIGVTSFGIGCGTIGTPGVYTRVSAYVPWIESIVWP